MKVKALVSFAGLVTMTKNETRDIKDKLIREDLIKAGYVEEVKSSRSRNKVTTHEDE